ATATAAGTGIDVSNGSIDGWGECAFWAGNYINGVTMDSSVIIGPPGRAYGSQRKAIILAENSVECLIEATLENIGQSVIGVTASVAADTTTFPRHIYPNGDPQHQLDCKLIGRAKKL